MTCDWIEEHASLYLYGELSPAEEDSLEHHLFQCRSCAALVESERRMHQLLSERELQPPVNLLTESRFALLRSLPQSMPEKPLRTPVSRMDSEANWFARFWQWSAGWRQPVGALALIAVGFLGARVWQEQGSGSTLVLSALASRSAEPQTSAVRWVQPEANGRVQIAVDETRQRLIQGSVSDLEVQRLLLMAAKDQLNPGLRVDSMDLLKGQSGSAEVRDILLAAVEHDKNAGVRLKALDGLKSFAGDTDTRKRLARVLLTDDNPGVRIQVVDLLMQQKDESLVGVLQTLVRKEDNNYVRLRCENALRDMKASVGTF